MTSVIPGRGLQAREPGIHKPDSWLWIPALASLGRNDQGLA
jgi:hypothetical protein